MQKKTSEEILIMMIELLLLYIEELFEYKTNDEAHQFQYGERLAYTECLEWIQLWEKAEEYGLYFDIEKRFPL